MTASEIARNLESLLSCNVTAITVDGEDYVVTLATGETAYGPKLGGGCAFAYEAHRVARFLVRWEDGTDGRSDDDQVRPYDAFCEDLTPTRDRAVALALAAEGFRLTEAGSCKPVLSDEEFLAARAA